MGAGEGLLRVLRTVLLNRPALDDGEEEKAARRWLEKNEKEFLNRKHELEEEERLAIAAEAARSNPDVASAKLAEDLGEGEARKLLSRLLTEFSEGV